VNFYVKYQYIIEEQPMTNKVYRTAQGKIVDLGALHLRNENVRAVGNMNVNARGDLVDSYNRPIDSKTQQVSRQYQKQTTNVQNQSTHAVKSKSEPMESTAQPQTQEIAPVVDDNSAGLAAAIARARQIKQTAIDPPRKTSKSDGISKI
jgi:hypothetical protein